jgi:hypothetical protein
MNFKYFLVGVSVDMFYALDSSLYKRLGIVSVHWWLSNRFDLTESFCLICVCSGRIKFGQKVSPYTSLFLFTLGGVVTVSRKAGR